MKAQLAHNVASVRFNRLSTDSQSFGNLASRPAKSKLSNHLVLAAGKERTTAIASRPGLASMKKSANQHVGNALGEIQTASRNTLNGRKQLAGRIRFEDQAPSAGL
jgi:hypothetical protein